MNHGPRTLFDWEIRAASESVKAQAPREEGIRFVGDMQRLKVEPGDVYVLNVDVCIDQETAERLKNNLQGVLGESTKCLVLSKGMTLGVMAGAAVDPKPAETVTDAIRDSTLTGGGDVAEPKPAEVYVEGTCGSGSGRETQRISEAVAMSVAKAMYRST